MNPFRVVALAGALAVFTAADARAVLIPNAIGGVTGIPFHQGDSAVPGADGNVARVFDGSGLTVGNTADPNTWLHNNRWQDGWQGQDAAPTNGTLIADLGSTRTDLSKMYIWNVAESGAANRGTNDADIFYATSPAVAPTAGTMYNFASGGWTLLQNVDIPIGLANNADPISLIVDLASVPQARYIGISMNTNHGATNGRIGFAEIQFTAVPEPAALSILGVAAVAGLARTRRRGA